MQWTETTTSDSRKYWGIFFYFNVGYISSSRHGESDISMKLNSILYSCRWHYMLMDNCLVAFIKEDQWGTCLLYYGFLWCLFILWTLWWPSTVFAFEAINLSSFVFWMPRASFSKMSFNHNHFYCCWSLIILKKRIAFIGVEGSNYINSGSADKLISKKTGWGENSGFWAQLYHVCILGIFHISNSDIALKAGHSPILFHYARMGHTCMSTGIHESLLYLLVP